MGGLVEGGRPVRATTHRPSLSKPRSTGTDAANVRFKAWQFRQILAAAFTESCCASGIGGCGSRVCRIVPISASFGGIDPNLPSPIERMHGATREAASGRLGLGTRGRGSKMTAGKGMGLVARGVHGML